MGLGKGSYNMSHIGHRYSLFFVCRKVEPLQYGRVQMTTAAAAAALGAQQAETQNNQFEAEDQSQFLMQNLQNTINLFLLKLVCVFGKKF